MPHGEAAGADGVAAHEVSTRWDADNEEQPSDVATGGHGRRQKRRQNVRQNVRQRPFIESKRDEWQLHGHNRQTLVK